MSDRTQRLIEELERAKSSGVKCELIDRVKTALAEDAARVEELTEAIAVWLYENYDHKDRCGCAPPDALREVLGWDESKIVEVARTVTGAITDE